MAHLGYLFHEEEIVKQNIFASPMLELILCGSFTHNENTPKRPKITFKTHIHTSALLYLDVIPPREFTAVTANQLSVYWMSWSCLQSLCTVSSALTITRHDRPVKRWILHMP